MAAGCTARREGGDMIAAPSTVKVLVATRPVDFRKGADGLAAMVREQIGHDPFSGTIFIFRSKRADRLKILAWDGSGLVLGSGWSMGVPLAADQRRRDAAKRLAARRAGGWPGLVASACPRHRAADRDIVSSSTD